MSLSQGQFVPILAECLIKFLIFFNRFLLLLPQNLVYYRQFILVNLVVFQNHIHEANLLNLQLEVISTTTFNNRLCV